MDRNALDWLFSTSPQAITALIGLIVTGTSFIYGKIEDRIESDPTLAEICSEFKSQIHSSLKELLYKAVGVVVIDLCCLFFNPVYVSCTVRNGECLLIVYQIIAILVLLSNIWLLYQTINFVKVAMNPSYVESTVIELSNKYNNQEKNNTNVVNATVFIQNFIMFESLLRHSKIFSDKKDNYQRPLSVSQMLRELRGLNMLSTKDYQTCLEINRIRNIILHEGDIQKVDKRIDSRLQEITNKLKDTLNK